MTNTCDCTRPCGDAFACSDCTKAATDNLRHIADLASALSQKRAKVRSSWNLSDFSTSKPAVKWRTNTDQVVTPSASPHFTPSNATHFDPRVSRVRDRVQNALVGIARDVLDHHDDGSLPRDASPAVIAHWLTGHVRWIRLQPDAKETFAMLGKICGELHHLFDNRPPTLFLGECKAEFEDGECTESLYLDQDKITSDTVDCPRCGITHDVAERRKTLMEGVDDYHGTAKEISRLLRNIGGTDVSTAAIARYVRMGKLASVGTRMEVRSDGQMIQVSVYRIGAVRELVRQLEDAKRQRRLMKRVPRTRLDKDNDRAC